MTLRGKTLDDAKNLVDNDRNASYGEPIDDFSKVVGALNAYGYRGPGGRLLTPHDVPFLQIVVKLSRLVTSPAKEDSWVDIAGYAACGNEVSQQQASLEPERVSIPKESTWRWTPSLDGNGQLELHLPLGTTSLPEQQISNGLSDVYDALKIRVPFEKERILVKDEKGYYYLWDAIQEAKDDGR